MILVGFLAQVALTEMMGALGSYFINAGYFWFLLIGLAAGAGGITIMKNKENIVRDFLSVSIGSFLFNLCSYIGNYSIQSRLFYEYLNVYTYCTIPVMVIASLLVTLHIKNESQESPEDGKLPRPVIFLFGLCIYITIGKCIFAAVGDIGLCGIAYWIVLLLVSVILTILTYLKTPEQSRILRSLFTFGGSLFINLIAGQAGSIGDLVCELIPLYDRYYFSVLIPMATAVTLLIMFLKMDQTSQGVVVVVPANAPSYPPPASNSQASYPTTGPGPQASYPPPQATYPQATYPQAAYPPPQAAYPPPQAAYPPPQEAYPPPQAAYPPPQAAYPPPQAAYPPPQAAYPPPQAAYPPPQAAYPPPQAAYPPPQGAYPQAAYPPRQAAYPPPQVVYPPANDANKPTPQSPQ